jgi:vacuolar-type H+-ATPase subunit I/STV1
LTELEQLKKQAEELQQRIEELEEQQKKEKYKSLHNVIAKWEYYYSEKLEKRIMHGMHSGNVSYRDIVEEEIENLLNAIENWLDIEIYFSKDSYHFQYFMGWDECLSTIKKKLRSQDDFYGKSN